MGSFPRFGALRQDHARHPEERSGGAVFGRRKMVARSLSRALERELFYRFLSEAVWQAPISLKFSLA
jgi:hypothetical protein